MQSGGIGVRDRHNNVRPNIRSAAQHTRKDSACDGGHRIADNTRRHNPRDRLVFRIHIVLPVSSHSVRIQFSVLNARWPSSIHHASSRIDAREGGRELVNVQQKPQTDLQGRKGFSKLSSGEAKTGNSAAKLRTSR